MFARQDLAQSIGSEAPPELRRVQLEILALEE